MVEYSSRNQLFFFDQENAINIFGVSLAIAPPSFNQGDVKPALLERPTSNPSFNPEESTL